MDSMSLALVLLALILVISGTTLFFLFFQATSQHPKKNRPVSSRKTPAFKPSNCTHHLEKRLLTLLYGNQEVAHRLVKSIRKKYPEKDKIWCLEKVIGDLEEDRR
jgi:uncharacterized protein (UPF0333 family)